MEPIRFQAIGLATKFFIVKINLEKEEEVKQYSLDFYDDDFSHIRCGNVFL